MNMALLQLLPSSECVRIGFNQAAPGITFTVGLRESIPIVEHVRPNVLSQALTTELSATASLEGLAYDGALTFTYFLDGEVTVNGHILGLNEKDFQAVASRLKLRFEPTMQTALESLRSVLNMVVKLIEYHQSSDPAKGEYTFLQPVHPWFTDLMREFVSIVKAQHAQSMVGASFAALADHQPMGEA